MQDYSLLALMSSPVVLIREILLLESAGCEFGVVFPCVTGVKYGFYLLKKNQLESKYFLRALKGKEKLFTELPFKEKEVSGS